MRTEIVITDITRMSHNFICIAGVREKGISVRPILENGRFCDEWCCVDGLYIKPFSKVVLDLLKPRNLPPHTEDYLIDPNVIEYSGDLTEAEKHQLLIELDDGHLVKIFGAPVIRSGRQKTVYVKSGTGTRSLGVIQPKQITDFNHNFAYGNWDYRLSFTDQSGATYRIKIVDLSFQTFVDYKRICQKISCEQIQTFILNRILRQRELFLRIGLARGWADYPDRCFLQITGVYTFPDYMQNDSFQVLQRAIAANYKRD